MPYDAEELDDLGFFGNSGIGGSSSVSIHGGSSTSAEYKSSRKELRLAKKEKKLKDKEAALNRKGKVLKNIKRGRKSF